MYKYILIIGLTATSLSAFPDIKHMPMDICVDNMRVIKDLVQLRNSGKSESEVFKTSNIGNGWDKDQTRLAVADMQSVFDIVWQKPFKSAKVLQTSYLYWCAAEPMYPREWSASWDSINR